MNKKYIIIIILVLCIVQIIVFINKNVKIKENNDGDTIRKINVNAITNESTGLDEHIIYDKKTGKEITRVDEEYQIKIYELDPNFEEIK